MLSYKYNDQIDKGRIESVYAPRLGTSKSVLMTTIRWTTAASDRKWSCQLEQGRSAWLWFDSKGGHNEMLTHKAIIARGAKGLISSNSCNISRGKWYVFRMHPPSPNCPLQPHPHYTDHNLYFVPLYIHHTVYTCAQSHVLWEELSFIWSFLMISLQASELSSASAEMNNTKKASSNYWYQIITLQPCCFFLLALFFFLLH